MQMEGIVDVDVAETGDREKVDAGKVYIAIEVAGEYPHNESWDAIANANGRREAR